MPKKKCSKRVSKKRTKAFKFDANEILKERREDAARKSELCKESKKSDEEMKTLDELYRAAVRSIMSDEDDDENQKLDHFVFDNSTYNIPHDESSFSDINKSCLQRFLIISIEQNELQASVHYHNLMNAGWSPELNDVRNALHNWDVDLDDIICKTHLESPINSNKRAGRHNYEFLFNFIMHNILKNNKFSNNDLLKLAKFAVIMYFNLKHEKVLNVIKRLFSVCIKTALHEDNETDILMFARELYSKYEDHLLKMIVDLFLPLDGQIMKKLYTILTFNLFKSFLGQNDDFIIECPANEWFVQDLVDINYFSENQQKRKSVILLLEHVVVIFDLYKDEKKLSDMYDFLLYGMKPSLSSDYQNLVSILDHWKLELFRLHVERNSNLF